jgi:poly(A) polymerase
MVTLQKKLVFASEKYMHIIMLLRFAGGQARLVGGAVRDALAGIPCTDMDIATDFKPDQVIKLLENNKIRVLPTGIKFGTVSALIGKETFEITTLRKDISCDGRHANVAYTDDFLEDAKRRDFTINAINYCPVEHKIYDYFNGIKDLKENRVVFIGDANTRIQEDYLRILRFFRFSCRFASNIDSKGFKACISYKDKLDTLSKERIKAEMDAILKLEKSPDILQSMSRSNILQKIFQASYYHYELHLKAIKIAKIYGTWPCLPVMYAIIFQQETEISLKSLMNLKFSKAEATIIKNLINLANLREEDEIKIKLKTIWLEQKLFIYHFIYLSATFDNSGFIYDLYIKLQNKTKPSFPVNGNDLIKLGLSGKKIGYIVSRLKNDWIASDFTLQKNDLIKLIKKYEQ